MYEGSHGVRRTGSALPSVGSSGIRQEVVEILREAIWTGTLRPGERLNEQWISREMGVSRPPLREAIRVLEQEGLVESQPRRGTFVTNLTGDDIMEIYVLRCALEATAAQTLAAQAPDEVFDELEAHLDSRDQRLELAGLIEHDLAFHRQLVNAAGNRRLAQMWEQLASQLRLALVRVDPAFFEDAYVDATHRQLVKAMRAHDLDLVRAAVKHLLDVGEQLRNQWDSTLADAPG
jgi:DNA-binding GntR family transcriptional regulator